MYFTHLVVVFPWCASLLYSPSSGPYPLAIRVCSSQCFTGRPLLAFVRNFNKTQSSVEATQGILSMLAGSAYTEELRRTALKKESSHVQCVARTIVKVQQHHLTYDYWHNGGSEDLKIYMATLQGHASFHNDIITDHLHHQIYSPPTFYLYCLEAKCQIFGLLIFPAIFCVPNTALKGH